MLDNPEIRQRVLDQLVNERLMYIAAVKSGMSVPNSELQAVIADIPAFKDDSGKFSTRRYSEMLNAQGMNEGMFEAALRKDMMVGRNRDALANTAFLPNAVTRSTVSPAPAAARSQSAPRRSVSLHRPGQDQRSRCQELLRQPQDRVRTAGEGEAAICDSDDGRVAERHSDHAERAGGRFQPAQGAAATGRGAACPPHPDCGWRQRHAGAEGRGEGKSRCAGSAGEESTRGVCRAGQAKLRRPRFRPRRRGSGFLHARQNGQAVRRSSVRHEDGRDRGSGGDFVRLSHHQARRREGGRGTDVRGSQAEARRGASQDQGQRARSRSTPRSS